MSGNAASVEVEYMTLLELNREKSEDGKRAEKKKQVKGEKF